jgi:hypothetical protein
MKATSFEPGKLYLDLMTGDVLRPQELSSGDSNDLIADVLFEGQGSCTVTVPAAKFSWSIQRGSPDDA